MQIVRTAPQSRRVFRFGQFELDTSSGELRKGGVRIRVADQAIQVLTSLLERPGEVVTREELTAVLWPVGTHVDFENGLSTEAGSRNIVDVTVSAGTVTITEGR